MVFSKVGKKGAWMEQLSVETKAFDWDEYVAAEMVVVKVASMGVEVAA